MGKTTPFGYTRHLAWKDLTSHPLRFIMSLLLFALPLFAIAGVSTTTSSENNAIDTLYMYGVEEPVPHEDGALAFDSSSATVTIDGTAAQFELAIIAPGQDTSKLDKQRIAPALASDTAPRTPGEGEILIPRTISDLAHISPGNPITLSAVGENSTPTSLTVTGVINGTSAVMTGPVDNPRYWIPANNEGPFASSITFDAMNAPAYLLFILLAAALTTPVFALGFHRMRRALGTLAINGAESRHLQAIALWEGFIVSALGAVIGIALGLGAAAAILASNGKISGFTITPDALIAFSVFVILAGLLSAWLPARTNIAPAHWLTSRDMQVTRPRWYLVIGPLLLLASTLAEDPFLVGIGVLLTGPALLVVAQHLPLPYGAKLATRLTPRAGLATGAIGALLFITSFGFGIMSEGADTNYQPSTRGVVRVSPDIMSDNAQLFGPKAHEMLQAAHPLKEADLYSAHISKYSDCSWQAIDVCSHYLVADPEVLTMLPLAANEVDEANKAIAAGHAVEFVPSSPADGTPSLAPAPAPGLVVDRVPTKESLTGTFIPVDLAHGMGLKLQYEGAIGYVGETMSPLRAARFVASSDSKAGFRAYTLGPDSNVFPALTVSVAFGWLTTCAAVLLLVIIAGSYTRHSRALMVSIGAQPGFLRKLGMYQGLVVTVSAALIAATGLGLFLFVGNIDVTGWIILIGAPIIGALTGWLAASNNTPALSRRA